MSSYEVISRVLAIREKAEELQRKGHVLRAAEYYGRAAEAARTLDPGPDNFVALRMLRSRAVMLMHYCRAATDAPGLAAHCGEIIAHLSSVVSALERRRVAGTLLEGKCSAAEEAWLVCRDTFKCSASKVAELRKFFGYETYLLSAVVALDVIASPFLGPMCSIMDFEAFSSLIVRAMDMMQLPSRRLGPFGLTSEIQLTIGISKFMTLLSTTGMDPRLVQLLKDSWQRFRQSGVIEKHGLLDERVFDEIAASYVHKVAAVRAALFAPGLRCCALASCGVREAHPQHFKSCAACLGVVYCCREHQVADWSAHKAACKSARKSRFGQPQSH